MAILNEFYDKIDVGSVVYVQFDTFYLTFVVTKMAADYPKVASALALANIIQTYTNFIDEILVISSNSTSTGQWPFVIGSRSIINTTFPFDTIEVLN